MQIGEAIEVIKSDTVGEVIGIYPLGQNFSISTNGQEYYQIVFEGFKGLISRELFDVVFKPYTKMETPKVETPEEPVPVVVKSNKIQAKRSKN